MPMLVMQIREERYRCLRLAINLPPKPPLISEGDVLSRLLELVSNVVILTNIPYQDFKEESYE